MCASNDATSTLYSTSPCARACAPARLHRFADRLPPMHDFSRPHHAPVDEHAHPRLFRSRVDADAHVRSAASLPLKARHGVRARHHDHGRRNAPHPRLALAYPHPHDGGMGKPQRLSRSVLYGDPGRPCTSLALAAPGGGVPRRAPSRRRRTRAGCLRETLGRRRGACSVGRPARAQSLR